MKDQFRFTLAVCSAASVFGSGAYVAYSGLESIVVSRMESVMEQRQAKEEKILSGSDAGVELAETARKALGKAFGVK